MLGVTLLPSEGEPCLGVGFGTPGVTRTRDLLLRRQALYPLSYGRKQIQRLKSWPSHASETEPLALAAILLQLFEALSKGTSHVQDRAARWGPGSAGNYVEPKA